MRWPELEGRQVALNQFGPSHELKSQTDLSGDTAQESSPKSCCLAHLCLQMSFRNINREARKIVSLHQVWLCSWNISCGELGTHWLKRKSSRYWGRVLVLQPGNTPQRITKPSIRRPFSWKSLCSVLIGPLHKTASRPQG